MDREPEPTCMYKRGAFGRVESRIFDHPDDVPEGWYDSPAKVPAEAASKPKAKRKKKNAA